MEDVNMADLKQPIDFWFSIGSTYTYLSAMRLPDVARREGLEVRWQPFDVRAIMVEQNNIPFRDKPVKAAYMWRDVERRAAGYGLPFAGIPPYPIKGLARANRIALVAFDEGWIVPYVQSAYRRWFQRLQDPATDESLLEDLPALGQDARRVIALADAPQFEARLQEQTERAKRLGVFGSPTWAVGDELFWGDDRLDDAIGWLRGTLRMPPRLGSR
jgi:2-hydroxychromene-2-carboxylate isomerase